jgi:uncharacterized phage protein gp47/JayE
MTFTEDFDELLDAILTDYRNQFPEADTSQGSLIFIKSACLASALWGLYRYQDWIAKQIFPDTADTEALEQHAWTRGLSRTSGETDAAYLARLLEYIRRPPAGGNKYDYIKWAKEVDNVADAWCLPLARGRGTVDVIILANETVTGSEIPSSSARIGINTSVSSGKLVDSGAAFTTGHAAAAGDIVENPLRETRATVTAVDDANTLSLSADIFQFVNEPYIAHCQCGTSTSVSSGKLVDSAGAFDDATYTVRAGDAVENVTDGTETTVVSVDSASQMTLTDDIFTDTGKAYLIRGLIADVKKYIDPLRPVTASKVSVVAPVALTQAVTMTVTGTGIDTTAIADEIETYLEGMIPGQTLYLARLIQIAMDNGADNVTVSVPSADVVPTSYEMLRPGVISVS